MGKKKSPSRRWGLALHPARGKAMGGIKVYLLPPKKIHQAYRRTQRHPIYCLRKKSTCTSHNKKSQLHKKTESPNQGKKARRRKTGEIGE